VEAFTLREKRAMNRSYLVTALRRIVSTRPAAESTDSHLLECYVASREEAAFAALVRRHGGMVWGVCRRVLSDANDADDAFQATFLVLVHKAASLRGRESLASFLQGVAWRLARRVKADAARRQARERRAEAERSADAGEDVMHRDLRQILDEELDRLPEKYRAPLILCYLEGKSYTEAARELGWKDGTVCDRLARAREMLRRQLTRRGLTLSGAALAAPFVEPMTAPAASVAAVLRMATLFALGQSAAGTIPTSVATLAQGILHTMAVAKLKTVGSVVLAVCVFAAGAGWAAHQVLTPKPAETKREEAKPAAKPDPAQQAKTDIYGDPLPPGVLVRMGTVRLRHDHAGMAFSADGKTLISYGWDGWLRYWDVATGKQIRSQQLERTPEEIARFRITAVAPGGARVAVRHEDVIDLYDTAGGAERRRLDLGSNARGNLTFSPDGKRLAAATTDAKGQEIIRLWDVAEDKNRPVLTVKGSSWRGIVFSPDGKRLLSHSSRDGVLHVWDTATGRELRGATIEKVPPVYATDGKTLAVVGGDERTIRLLDASSLAERVALKLPDEKDVICLAFSADGALLAAAGEKAVVVWDVAARKEKHRLADVRIDAMLFAPRGHTLACWGGRGSELRLWDAAAGRRLNDLSGHSSRVVALAVSSDGKVAASGSMYDPMLRLWEVATGKPLRVLKGHGDLIIACALSADGTRVVSSSGEGVLQLWDVATGKELRRFEVEVPPGASPELLGVGTLWLSADGKRLAAIAILSGSDRPASAILHLWDTATGELLAHRPYKIESHVRDRPNGGLASRTEVHAAFTPDGAGVTVRAGKRLAIEETISGHRVALLPENVGRLIVFSPDGRLMAASSFLPKSDPFEDYQVDGFRLIETASGEEIFHIRTGEGPVAFSRDGRSLATVDAEGIHRWDVATGAERFRRPWPEGVSSPSGFSPAFSLAFLPDGHAVVTGMDNGTILVWDLEPRSWPVSKPPSLPDRKELDALWSDLAGDAPTAHRAIHKLTAQAVPFLAERLRPALSVEAKRVEQLLADLDGEAFAAREAAVREVIQLREQIEPALHRALASNPSLETRKRLQSILTEPLPPPSKVTLRTLRTIAVLERFGTPEARQILHKLASGADGARETRTAKAALGRLRVGGHR
jgi:RNA polymerase sigma factor (sigma-70 family)